MNTVLLGQLEECLNQKKFDEAKDIIKNIFSLELSPQDKGRAHIEIFNLYLTLMNEINTAHKESLENLVEELQILGKEE